MHKDQRHIDGLKAAAKIKRLAKLVRKGDRPTATAAARALGDLGDPAVCDVLIGALRSSEPPVRGRAAEALGRIGGPRVVQPLLETVRDDADDGVRRDAALALGEVGDAQAVEVLLELIHSDRSAGCRVAEAAMSALTAIGESQAVDGLLEVARRGSPAWARAPEHSIQALAAIGDARAIDALCEIAQRVPPARASSPTTWPESEAVRLERAAARALGELGDPRAVPILAREFAKAPPDPSSLALYSRQRQTEHDSGAHMEAVRGCPRCDAEQAEAEALVSLSRFGADACVRALREVDVGVDDLVGTLVILEATGAALPPGFTRDVIGAFWSDPAKEGVRQRIGEQLERFLKDWVHPDPDRPTREASEAHLRAVLHVLGEQCLPVMADLFERWLHSDEEFVWSVETDLGRDSYDYHQPARYPMLSGIQEVLPAALRGADREPSPLPPLTDEEREHVLDREELAATAQAIITSHRGARRGR